jgi:hypothetical protein
MFGMIMEKVTSDTTGSLLSFARRATALRAPPDLIEMMPVAIYACDAQGRLLWFDRRAVEIWGNAPVVGEEPQKFYCSYRLYYGGKQISSDETPMAKVLRTGNPMRGVEGRVERPDGSSVWAVAHIEPVKDDEGRVIGAINCFHETTAVHAAAVSATRRAEEQGALHEFAARLQRATSARELYELAMTAIVRAMHCQRAAILLFDAGGVMRFAASRGLSEGYRCLAEGHSPWRADSCDAVPICIGDVDRADLPDALKKAVRAEGIGALCFIPTMEDDRLIGKFMAYHDATHAFAASEVEAGLAIARQFVLARTKPGARSDRAARHNCGIVGRRDHQQGSRRRRLDLEPRRRAHLRLQGRRGHREASDDSDPARSGR